ncbi:MAG TPA: M23 family peptidase, partial [Dyella sp.]|nr:M23 family peptidase [Dyella sp.]
MLLSVLAQADAQEPIPRSISQGQLVIAQLPAGSTARLDGKPLRVGPDGSVVFGAGRDEIGPLVLTFGGGYQDQRTVRITVTPRDWPIERVDGVPPKTVNPPPATAARIRREQAQVTAARGRDDSREDFLHGFVWPVHGRISGRFGNQRIYNGDPRAP